MRLKADDWHVRPVLPREARIFVKRHHYSGSCSNTGVYFHGLFRKGEHDLLGAALWLPPTRVAAESVDRENWQRVLSLSRLACHPSVPPNGASFLMGRSIRLIKGEGKWATLVTYADEAMQHTGAIYLATNWTDCGWQSGSPRYVDAEGRQGSRKATHSRTNAEMLALGFRQTGTFRKRKFVMKLPTKASTPQADQQLTLEIAA